MRVLHLLPALSMGGVESHVLEIAKAVSNEHKIRQYVCSSGGDLVGNIEDGYHITISDIGSKNPLKVLLNAFKLLQVIDRLSIDIVHVHSRIPAWVVTISTVIRRILSGRSIIWLSTFHGVYGHSNFFKTIYNSAMFNGDCCIAISHYIAQHIEDQYSKCLSKKTAFSIYGKPQLILQGCEIKEGVQIADRGVLLQQLLDDAYQCHNTNSIEEFIYDSNTRVILLPARFTKIKGHEYCIDILECLSQMSTVKYICIFLGPIDSEVSHNRYLQKLMHLASSRQVPVLFIEHSISQLYAIADIVLSLSQKAEAFGKTVIEARMLGRMTLAIPSGAIADNLPQRYHLPNNDAKSAANIIQKHWYEVLSRDEVEDTRSKYSLQRSNKAIFKLYSELLSR